MRESKNFEFLYTVPEIKEFREKNLQEQKRTMELLDEFYKGREISVDVWLVLMPIGIYGSARLTNAGVLPQDIRSKREQKEKLKQYRQEMVAFTAFLKKKYFQT